MNNRDRETLSAMLDNEADELEIRRLLRDAESDSELQETWQRLSLVQAVLHDDNVKATSQLRSPSLAFSERVAKAIAAEPIPQSTQTDQTGTGQWRQPVAKLAIAASVALAFFLGMQTTLTSPENPGALPVAQQAPAGGAVDSLRTSADGVLPVTAIADSSVVDAAIREVDPEARQRLEDYIRSVSITREEPRQLEQLQDSPLYRLVNEVQDSQ